MRQDAADHISHREDTGRAFEGSSCEPQTPHPLHLRSNPPAIRGGNRSFPVSGSQTHVVQLSLSVVIMRSFVSCVLLVASVACSLSVAASEGNLRVPTKYGINLTGRDTVQACGVDIKNRDIRGLSGAIPVSDPDNCMGNCHIIYGNAVNAASWIKINGRGFCFCKYVDLRSVEMNELFVPKVGVVSYIEGYDLEGEKADVAWGSGWDFEGNNIGHVPAIHDAECAESCMGWDGCFAFVWTRYQGGTCWLKSKAGRMIYVGEIAHAGYALRQFERGRCRV